MKKFTSLLLSLIMLVSALGVSFYAYAGSDGVMKVTYLYVGQADCTFVELPDGKTMLIDAGLPTSKDNTQYTGPEYVKNFLDSKLDKVYSKKGYIDYVVATHPHWDHIGGMAEIIKSYDIGTFYMPDLPYTSSAYYNKMNDGIDNVIVKQENARDKAQLDLDNWNDAVAAKDAYDKWLQENPDYDAEKAAWDEWKEKKDAHDEWQSKKDALDEWNERFPDPELATEPKPEDPGIEPEIPSAEPTNPGERMTDPGDPGKKPSTDPDSVFITNKQYITSGYCIENSLYRVECFSPTQSQIDNKPLESSMPAADYSDDIINHFSIVLKITYNKKSFLFEADAEKEEEARMIATYGKALKSDVLKIGHHGSSTSTTEEFLKAVQPESVVISCGINNPYGHPTNQTVTRIHNIDTKIYRTDYDGGKDIEFVTNGVDISTTATDTRERIEPTTVFASIDELGYTYLNWYINASAKGYYIYRSESEATGYTKIATIKSKDTNYYSDTSASAGKVYYYKVACYGKYVSSDDSNVVTSVRNLYAPTATAAKNTITSNKVEWTKVPGASGYYVYRATEEGGKFKKLATISGNKTFSYIDKKLTTGKTYYYKVKAYCKASSASNSPYSVVVRAKPIPAQATNVKVKKVTVKGKKAVKISWKKFTSVTGYRVYRATSKNGKYTRIASISSNKTTSFTDKTAKTGKKYYYKVRAYKTVNKKKVFGTYSTKVNIKL